MKGIVFKELLEMVESGHGDEVVEEIIASSNLKSQGAYTSVGTYDHLEILSLVSALSTKLKVPIEALVKSFGEHLVGVFNKGYPAFFEHNDIFSFLESVDGYIHVEVKKLYPDAELPTFATQRNGENELVMHYSSKRPFAALAEGLIKGSIQHFGSGEKLETVFDPDSGGKKASFYIRKA